MCTALGILTITSCAAAISSETTTRSPTSQGMIPKHLLDGAKNGCASGLATICCKTILQPFDTIKTVQQASTKKLSLVAVARTILKEQGFGGLYKGLPVALLGSVPAMSMYWAVYQSSRSFIEECNPGTPALLVVALSSAVANTFASTLRVPCEVLKQQLQAGIHPNLWTAVRTLSASGLSGFFVPGALVSQVCVPLLPHPRPPARRLLAGLLTASARRAFRRTHSLHL